MVTKAGLTDLYNCKYLNHWSLSVFRCFNYKQMYPFEVLQFYILNLTDLADKDELVNGFALSSKLCVSSGWSALMVFTSELYPTVVR